MDSNDFYYTLSTISQSLAGMIGLLVAVVTFRVSELKDELSETNQKMQDLMAESETRHHRIKTFYTKLEKGSPEKHSIDLDLLKIRRAFMSKHTKTKEEIDSGISDIVTASEKLAKQYETIRGHTRLAVIATAITIGVCLLSLPWIGNLTRPDVPWWMCIFLIIVVIMAIGCVVAYVLLVLSLVEPIRERVDIAVANNQGFLVRYGPAFFTDLLERRRVKRTEIPKK